MCNPGYASLFTCSSCSGDIICYFKTDEKKKDGVSINSHEIGICKYKEILMATVKDAFDVLGYREAEKIESEILGMTPKLKMRIKQVN